jgi:hypothetical protein
MVSTYVLEGGLDYYKKGVLAENTYEYDVHIWEKSSEPGDLHSYRTDTQELRIKTASQLLGSRYHTGCESVQFISEESYLENSQRKKWLNGTWWKVKVRCDNPVNPKSNKFS